jgi:hypothetical protein
MSHMIFAKCAGGPRPRAEWPKSSPFVATKLRTARHRELPGRDASQAIGGTADGDRPAMTTGPFETDYFV